jgi:hypothetical protein
VSLVFARVANAKAVANAAKEDAEVVNPGVVIFAALTGA